MLSNSWLSIEANTVLYWILSSFLILIHALLPPSDMMGPRSSSPALDGSVSVFFSDRTPDVKHSPAGPAYMSAVSVLALNQTQAVDAPQIKVEAEAEASTDGPEPVSTEGPSRL